MTELSPIIYVFDIKDESNETTKVQKVYLNTFAAIPY